MHTTTFSPSDVFFFLSLSRRSAAPSCANAHTFLSIDICGVGPCDSCHLCCAGLPPSPPPPSSAGSLTAGAERLASEHHFLSGALPPARCSGRLFISHRDSSKDRICGTLSVWAQMSASVAAASPPCWASPSRSRLLPPPGPLLHFAED